MGLGGRGEGPMTRRPCAVVLLSGGWAGHFHRHHNKPTRQRMTLPLRNTPTTYTQPKYLFLIPIHRKVPKAIKGVLSVAHTTRCSVSLAAVLVSLYNHNGNRMLLFEARGKLRVHPGQVGWVSSRWSIFTHDGQISQAERSTRPMNRLSTPR